MNISKFLPESADQGEAEEALRKSEQRLQDILDNTTAVVFVKDLELRYILVNREYERRHQVRRSDIWGKTDFDIHSHDVAETVRANDRHVIEAGAPIQFEETVPMAEGERKYVVVKFLLRDSEARPYAICGIATDITEIKHAEELQARRARQTALRADIHAALSSGAEPELRTVLQRTTEAIVRHLDGAIARIWTLDSRKNVLELEASAGLSTRLDGKDARVPVGKPMIGLIAQERKPYLTNEILTDDPAFYSECGAQLGIGSFAGYPLQVEGRLVGVLAMFARQILGNDVLEALEAVADGIAQGIERKRAEARLAKLNRTLRTLYQCNRALVRATEEYALLRAVCGTLVEIGGLKMAWVGYRESNEDFAVHPVARAGSVEGPPNACADTRHRGGPTGTTCCVSNCPSDQDLPPWFGENPGFGCASTMFLPLTFQGQMFGALALHANEPDAFADGAIEQYKDLANNLAYGVIALRTREERRKAENEIRQLNASLEKRVTERTIELVQSNNQLKRAEEQLRKHGEQVQIHRDVLLELARSDKSALENALRKICSLSAATLEVARVSYWSLQENGSTIGCEVLYLRDGGTCDEMAVGARLGYADCPSYFEALSSKRPIVADRVLVHPATSGLGDIYLKPLGISSMLDAPVWVGGEVVGVLCHEHTGPPRDWSPEEIDFVSALASMVSLALEESSRAQSEQLLRESEGKFRALFEGTSQAVVLHDENGILEVNPSWLRLFGYSSLQEVVGKHPGEISAPIQVGGLRADELAARYIASAVANGSARFDWTMLRRDGTEMPIEVFLTPIKLRGRQVIQAVCNDITQRKQTEAELLRTLEREKELGQLRNMFISMVSHEFRTPLAIIQSSAEIMDDYFDQLPPGERGDHLQSIRKNTRRMAGIMEEVLLLGSFDAGRMQFEPESIDLRPITRKLADEVRSATKQRCPIELSLVAIPAKVVADERLLRHIFTNVLTNAVKYSDPGCAVYFEIQCSAAEAVCTIRDNGIGIPEADQEWLFHAFHRGRNVADRPGTGLGLVIVKRCVDLHGGDINVHSRQGLGTTVTIRLPMHSQERTAGAARSNPAVKRAADPLIRALPINQNYRSSNEKDTGNRRRIRDAS